MALFYGQTVDLYEDFENATLETGLVETDAGNLLTIADATQYKRGAASLKIDANSFASGEAEITYTYSAVSNISFGFWYRTGSGYGTYNSNYVVVFILRTADPSTLVYMVDHQGGEAGTYEFLNATSGHKICDTAINTWYWITVQFNRNATSYISAYSEAGILLGTDSWTGVDANSTNCLFPYIYTNCPVVTYIDEVVFDKTDATFPLLGWDNKTYSPSGSATTSGSATVLRNNLITSGSAYVDTVNGIGDSSHGAAPGTGACNSLKTLINNRIRTLTGNLTIYCVGGSDIITSTLPITGISSATYKLTITGDRWTDISSGLYSTAKYNIRNDYNDNALVITEANIELDNIQVDLFANGTFNSCFRFNTTGTVGQILTVKNCYFRQTGTGANNTGINFVSYYTGSTVNVINSIISGISLYGINNNSGYVMNISNCTFHGNGTAIVEGGTLCTVKNCIFDGNTADQVSAWNAASDYNSTTINAALNPDGAHDHHNCANFNFADLTNHDFRPTCNSDSVNIRNSGYAIGGLTTPDPLGTVRPSQTSYTRGAFEYPYGNRTVTVKPSGQSGTYTTLALAIAGEKLTNSVLTSSGMNGILNIVIDGDWSNTIDASFVGISGFTVDSSHYINIYTTSSCRHAGVWSASKYRIQANTGGQTLLVDQSYTRITGLQVFNPTAGGGVTAVVISYAVVGQTGMLFDSCIMKSNTTASSYALAFCGGNSIVRNCVMQASGIGIYSTWASEPPVAEVDNCTIGGCGLHGIQNVNGTIACKNTYAGGSGDSDFTGTITFTTCASSDAKTRTGVTKSIAYSTTSGGYFTNVTAGSEDLHIGLVSYLRAKGTSLTSTFTTDIDGQTRPTSWSIGADDFTYNDATETGGLFVINAEDSGVSPFQFNSIVKSGANALTEAGSAAAHGNLGYLFTFVGSAEALYGKTNIFTVSTDIWLRFYANFSGWTGSAYDSVEFVYARDANDYVNFDLRFELDSLATSVGYNLYIQNGGQLLLSHAGSAIFTKSAWHYIEIHFKNGTVGTGGAAVYIDGVYHDGNFTTYDTTIGGALGTKYFIIGVLSAAPSWGAGQYFYLDDIKAATSGPIGAYSTGGVSSVPKFMSYFSRRRHS